MGSVPIGWGKCYGFEDDSGSDSGRSFNDKAEFK